MFEDNWRVYRNRKVWWQLAREDVDVARCTVARLMKDIAIQGIIRGTPHRTTIPDKKAPCPSDKVNHELRVPAPNMFRISDFTHVATPRGASMSPSSSMPQCHKDIASGRKSCACLRGWLLVKRPASGPVEFFTANADPRTSLFGYSSIPVMELFDPTLLCQFLEMEINQRSE